ncbi:hypothetical protein [Rhodococcus koreensis]
MTSEIARIQLFRPVEAFRAADPGSCDVDHASTLLPPTGGDRR